MQKRILFIFQARLSLYSIFVCTNPSVCARLKHEHRHNTSWSPRFFSQLKFPWLAVLTSAIQCMHCDWHYIPVYVHLFISHRIFRSKTLLCIRNAATSISISMIRGMVLLVDFLELWNKNVKNLKKFDVERCAVAIQIFVNCSIKIDKCCHQKYFEKFLRWNAGPSDISMDGCVSLQYFARNLNISHPTPLSLSLFPYPSFHRHICPSILMLGRFPQTIFYWMNALKMAKLYGPFSWRWRQREMLMMTAKSTIFYVYSYLRAIFCILLCEIFMVHLKSNNANEMNINIAFGIYILRNYTFWAVCVCVDACLAASRPKRRTYNGRTHNDRIQCKKMPIPMIVLSLFENSIGFIGRLKQQ